MDAPDATNPSPAPARAMLNGVRFGLRLTNLLPLMLAGFMFVVTPNYFRPMVGEFLGLVVLAGAIALVAVGQAVIEIATRRMFSGHALSGIVLCAASMLFCTFPALWLVLLGPALLIILKAQNS